MKRVGCLPPVRGGIGERLDKLQLLDNGARPAVRDDDRQRVLVLRASMNEMNVEAIDLGDEIRVPIDPRFTLAPIVCSRPVACEFLGCRQWHALRKIGDGLLVGESCCHDAPTHFGEICFWKIHMKRTKNGLISTCQLCDVIHSCTPMLVGLGVLAKTRNPDGITVDAKVHVYCTMAYGSTRW